MRYIDPDGLADEDQHPDDNYSENRKERRSVRKYKRKFEKELGKAKEQGDENPEEKAQSEMVRKYGEKNWMWVASKRNGDIGENGSFNHEEYFFAGDLYRYHYGTTTTTTTTTSTAEIKYTGIVGGAGPFCSPNSINLVFSGCNVKPNFPKRSGSTLKAAGFVFLAAIQACLALGGLCMTSH